MVYEVDYKKPILYVVPIQSIMGKLPLVPVGDTGNIQYSMRNAFSGAPCDRRPDAGDGCRMWFGIGMVCNKSHGIATRKVFTCAIVCSGCALTILIGSLGSA